jgi:hypothetical protein
MKAGLKRIEATLHDLGTRSTTLNTDANESKKRPFSFRISIKSPEPLGSEAPGSEENINTVDISEDAFSNFAPEPILFPQHNSVQTFPAKQTGEQTPILPKFKTPNFSNHRHGANPAFAMNILHDIEEIVTGWQVELQNILHQIQNIYLEGPIVNGWLESNPPEPEQGGGGTATLRHGEIDRLMDYVEEICEQGEKADPLPRNGYRLCGVDAGGKTWSRPCPPAQIPSVSMAIARYQRLRHLLGRKQSLETRLNQLAESLVVLHGHVQQT